ncbi:MAG: NifB/NifX family molybdenum-iron cluster-binding protein [Promethearchaeia archaeon]
MKKFAISTEDKKVCPHFGRAPEFTFVTIEDNKIIEQEVVPSPGHSVGSIPKFINKYGAKYVITGGAGPMAIEFFKKFGIEVILGVSGTVEEVIQEVLNGTLKGGESLCTHD